MGAFVYAFTRVCVCVCVRSLRNDISYLCQIVTKEEFRSVKGGGREERRGNRRGECVEEEKMRKKEERRQMTDKRKNKIMRKRKANTKVGEDEYMIRMKWSKRKKRKGEEKRIGNGGWIKIGKEKRT